MVRNLLGILLALIAAGVAAWSPFRTWYGSRPGRDFQVSELFSSSGITGAQAGLWTGMFAPMFGAAVFALFALLLLSRKLLVLTGLIVAGFTILWMVRQGQAEGTLTAGAGGLGEGVGYALGAAVALLVAALVMRGRRPRGRRRKGRGRVDDGHTAAGSEFGEFYEQPYPHGHSGTTSGPHEAYQADVPPHEQRPHHPFYYDDSTPPQEWDPWAAGRPEPPPDQQGGGYGTPDDYGRRDDHGPTHEPRRRGEPPDQPPQGPQQQPPPD